MHHIMFDIDGTLVETFELDSCLFVDAVHAITGLYMDADWSKYRNVTDSGILDEFFDINGIQNKRVMGNRVKKVFVQKFEHSIAETPVREIPGAAAFLERLKAMDDIVVSFATGGWYESAVLKLESSGIAFSSIPIASSNDGMSRTEIMKIAASRATGGRDCRCTYFGDGIWDKTASEQLGYEFVLVGNKLKHMKNIACYEPVEKVLTYIGL